MAAKYTAVARGILVISTIATMTNINPKSKSSRVGSIAATAPAVSYPWALRTTTIPIRRLIIATIISIVHANLIKKTPLDTV